MTIFETPSQLNVLDEPAPVPNVNVFTEPATGKYPSSVKVPKNTCVRDEVMNEVVIAD